MLGPVSGFDIAFITSRETGIEINSCHKSEASKRDFKEGLTLVSLFELGFEDQVH